MLALRSLCGIESWLFYIHVVMGHTTDLALQCVVTSALSSVKTASNYCQSRKYAYIVSSLRPSTASMESRLSIFPYGQPQPGYS